MADLSSIPTTELLKDLADSVFDVYLSVIAMGENGADAALLSGGLISDRAGKNLHFGNVICAELLRRNYMPQPTG
jgi:hypothetical protein